MEFIRTNLLLVLGIVGTVLTLLGSIIGAIAKQRKTSLVLMVAVLFSAVMTAQQIISYSEGKQKEALKDSRLQQEKLLEESRGILIEKIKENVVQTRITVEGIASKLETASFDSVGTALTLVEDDPGSEDAILMLEYGKGTAQMWGRYANWIDEVAMLPDSRACLSITINAGHHYVTGMLLSYLYTSSTTRPAIREVLEEGRWDKFPDKNFINTFGLATQSIRYLLIYDHNKERLAGFADANQFASELVAYQQSGISQIAEEAINKNGTDIAHIQKRFPSVSRHVLQSAKIKPLVKRMIDDQIPEAVVLKNGRPYLLQLEQIVKLAASS